MSRKLWLLMTFALLIGTLNLTSAVRRVAASGTIYVRADGSIDPPDAPISTFDNVTYTLTGDIYDEIVVEKSNIVIDGADYVVEGTDAWSSIGINLTGRSNVIIKNLEIKGFFYGIYADSSNYNNIQGNNITANGYGGGIAFRYSLNNIVYGNNITDIQGGGILLEWASGNNVSRNNIMTNTTNDGWGIGITSSSNNILSGNNIMTNYRGGIYLGNSSDNSIAGNNITANNGGGVWLDSYSSNNIISGDTITKNGGHGIINAQSSNITISENNIRNNNQSGVLLGTSSYLSYNVVSGNNITNNKDGISLGVFDDCNNFISENNIANNSEAGIQIIPMHGAPSNILYHNNFINNTLQVNLTSPVSSIKWDNGYPSGGNYWSDYDGTDLLCGPYQNTTTILSDGIGDASYYIDENNQDNYPLMGTFSDFNATSECRVQTVCNSSISSFQYSGTSIRFNVAGEDGTAGFCRICIPTALMNATYRVFVNGTEVQCNPLPCSNSTHSYLSFTYSHSTEEIVIVSEFTPLIILPLCMIVTLLAVVVYRKKHAKISGSP